MKGLYWGVNTSSSKNSLSDSDSIYLVNGGEGFGEVERAIGISVMGVGCEGGGIFSLLCESNEGVEDFEGFKKMWMKWLQESFQGQLSEVFLKVYMASSEMRIDRIVALDNELEDCLSTEGRIRSREAGTWFLEGKNEIQRAPQWQKYDRSVNLGQCPGHVVTVFALQAALYHLPLLAALTSYVYFEWCTGIRAFGKKERLGNIDTSAECFHENYPESLDVVREVFASDFQSERSISAL